MAAIRSYRDLIVWQEAMSLAKSVYKLSANFPRQEVYGLTSQIRRASISISFEYRRRPRSKLNS
ncbi:four helix bundle protein [Anatilimnocola sp. NA78]|uniref:four helix bundle protein n=1 Tax=Anatilimnocola sp. NA78 TaxID=3415683 RepID=UPI003CE526B3